jgi:hypothetical protein
MSADVVNIRDFKRREEREAEIKRFADRLVELGDSIRASQKALPPDFGKVLVDHAWELYERDTAPCEMPPVQPSYTAPEQDPA